MLSLSVPKQKRLIGGMGHPELLTHYQYDRTAYRGGGSSAGAYNPYFSASFDEYRDIGGDFSNRLRHGATSGATTRYLLDDLLTEESLMQDISRGLREIAKTPSEDSGVELGSNYGLFGTSRDYFRHQSIDRKRLRSRALDDDPLSYMRHRSLDMPLGQYSGSAGEYGGGTAFDEYTRLSGGDRGLQYLTARDRLDSRRPWESYEYGKASLQRQDRLASTHGGGGDYLPLHRPHRQLPTPSMLPSSRRNVEDLTHRPAPRLFGADKSHLSKDEFLSHTPQVLSTLADDI